VTTNDQAAGLLGVLSGLERRKLGSQLFGNGDDWVADLVSHLGAGGTGGSGTGPGPQHRACSLPEATCRRPEERGVHFHPLPPCPLLTHCYYQPRSAASHHESHISSLCLDTSRAR
jgi:hypothetical protein